LIAQLRHEAMHDALTGLPNRALFSELAQAAVGRAEANGTLMATMIMDLDGFKTVNDTLGHHVGDQLLVSVAMRLREAAGPTVTVARLGGDEFAILMEQVPGPDEARAVAQALLSALEPPVTVGEERVSVGASVGVALAPRDGATSTGVLKCADIAMYAAKESSGGIRVYSEELEHTGSVLLPLVSDLRDAVSRGTVTIAVQPIVSLTDDKVLGVEALARWHHPEFGNVEPTTFLPLAERNGFVLPLTLLVLDLSLEACGRWFAEGRNLGIAVNLSPRVLAEPDLPAIVAAALERHGVPAHLLTLEITEGSVIADPGRAIRLLQELRAGGVRLAVDDFGTGYSSLTYLSRLPVQQIKIDKSFVQGLAHGERDLAIVRSIVDLGKNLGFEVVAEGIEDQATQRQLLALGCTIAQGFHLGRPMPVDAMPGWLQMRALDAMSAQAAEASPRTEETDAEVAHEEEDDRPLRLVR
jgi:diguanylate cyclase (GGDEF)-like protein